MTNIEVVRAWDRGRPGASRHLLTDGKNLYSYDLKIGFTRKGQKVVKNYTASGIFVSMTTSQHVSLAKRYADREVQPRS